MLNEAWKIPKTELDREVKLLICHQDKSTTSEGGYEDLVAESYAIYNVVSVADWRYSCANMLQFIGRELKVTL